jgi:hypothetical protein
VVCLFLWPTDLIQTPSSVQGLRREPLRPAHRRSTSVQSVQY